MVRETRHLWVTNQPEIVREDRIRDHFKRSTEDVSPQSFEPRGSSYYERNSRIVTETDQYIRRPNTYHASDLRGRTRDRLYRNGPCPYPSIIDRNIPTGHHRVSGWYDSSPSSISTISGPASSPAPRSVYGNVASAVVQPDTSLYDCQVFKNKKKSRSGSESPCGGSGSVNATSSHSSSHIVDRGNGGSAASSRSHSRSPSSCSSTNSTSSNSHASSPVSGSDPPLSSTSSTTSRTRNLQSAVSAPNQSGNPVVHSEDNRPLAICVRNLPARSSDTSLKDGLFHEYKKHGKVTWVKVVGQNSERYALVCFKKPDDVEKALEVSHDKLFFGCKIEVAPYQGYDVEDNEFRPYEAELDEYHPKSTRTLFIGNLEKDITGSDIRNHFECFGEIIEIDIKKQGLNAYAFCQYSDIVSVVKAMRKMDGEHLGNNRIKLGFGKSMPTNCVWIDGILDCVSENYLSQHFKGYGPITEVVIDRDRQLALVSFEQVQYAQLAVKEMRGEIIRGRKLQVDFASRECRDKFCSKVEKQTAGSSCNSTTERTNATETASYVASVPGTRFNRYGGGGSGSGSTTGGGASSTTDLASTSQSRSRASSFSRHSNLNSTTTTGATTTTAAAAAAAASSLGGASSPGGTSNRGGGCSGSSSSGGVVVGAGGNSSTTTSANTTSTATGGTTAVAAASGVGGNGGSGSGASSGAGGTTPRGNRSRGARHPDYDYAEQRFRNYDEYSQGSGASHDDESYNYPGNCTRSDSPQSRLGPIAGTNALDTLDTNSGRRRCDKSPGDIRNLQKERFQILEQLEECPSSGDELVSPKKRMKFDHSSHHHNHHHTISSLVSLHMNNQHDKIDQQLLLLQTQSTQPLQQSQLLSSSSATLLSTAATTPTLDCALTNSSNNPSSSLQPNLLIGDSNCDVISNHSNETSSSLHHRKCVEVRRLSECSSLKYGTQLSSTSTSSNSRRPSTELSGAGATTNMLLVGGGVTIRHTGATSGLGQEATTPMAYVAPHSVPCKRRRTGAGLVGPTLTNSTSDTNEHHSSRGRGHQLHSHHSHEASGGESADGSRPGTPLCDERPEVSLCEPRRIPRDKPHEPMMLPLPKFGIQFFQQHRVAAATLGPAATSLSSHTGQLYSSISSSSSCSSSTTTNNNNMNSSNNLLNNTSSSSTLLNSSSSHSSLSNTLSSPPLLVGTRLSAPSFHHHHSNSSMLHSSSHHHHHQMQQQQQQQQHHHHHQQQHHMNYHHGSHTSGVEQPPASPLRARSLSSNSSDSDMAPISTSPSIEERLKSLDEMYEIWSGGGGSISARSHSVTTDHHSSTTPQSRHKFLELDVNEVKPSEFVKRVLAKKSIFDDDLQRLKNISDKYEPVDFSNLTRGSLVSTSPGIPNLAATKTPVVGGNPAAKQTAQAAVFHSPGVNQLQRLNSPMNSPQAMSPYNSPSPSPIVTTAMVSKTAVTQQTVVPAQPAKGLQYPFPSHPPVVMTPTTPPAPGTPQSKPKIASITKSFSLQEKSTTQTAQPTVPSIATTTSSTRVLCKSASVPGSTNVGTVKTSAVPTLNTLPTSNTKSEENADATTTSSSRRSSADSSSTKCAYQRSVSANTSKKGDKAHKHNHRNDSDKKMTKSEKSRSESIDKRKSHSEEKDDTGDIHEKDTAVTSERLAEDERPKRGQSDMDKETVEKPATSSSNQKPEKEKSGRKEKRRDKEEKDREDREKKSADHEVERRECEEREKKEREERDRKERERREKEEKDRREREDRERREQEEMSRKEREERERRDELSRKEREERDRKEREERDRKEREERERREREERERKEREERERKEREECARREREERERREREEITRREREERERREREESIRRDREERERKEKEEVLRREREERERKEREEGLRREREERERRDYEERERREKEESERRDKDKEERERREKEKEERERRESEEHQQREREERKERDRQDRRSSHEERDVHDRKDYDETHERRDRKDREDRRPEIRNCEQKDSSTKEHHHHDDISKPDENHDRRDHRNKDDDYPHFRQSHHHHKEEKHHHKDSNENHAMNDDHSSSQKRRERRSSGSSPIRITKRRLSSQDSMENEESAKRMKTNAESRKLLDRLDSKDSNRSISKHHKSHSRASSISKNSEEKLLNSEERYRKDSGFDEKKSKDKEHKKYDKNTSSSHKYKKLSISMEKDDHEIRSPTEKSSLFDQHELRSSDDDHQQQLRHRSKKEHKEKKRHEYDEDGHRRSSDSKRHDNNRHDRKSTGRSEDGSQKNSGEKSRNKPPSRKMTQSSNDSDSDEPKKHSIFDILDDGPYVSMYDKVKARSCKNMQKQEEEKKIKAKFSQLKQSRAKREEKKRSTSYDGDSDSDFDDRQGKYKSPYKMSRGGFINSSSDDDGSTINRHKDTPISDSDSDARRAQYNRDRLNQLCDGDSSEGGSVLGKSASCKKISLKRNSRSTRIVSDSSDTETSHRIKNENRENRQNDDMNIKTEMKVEGDDLESKTKVDRFGSLKAENLKDEPNDAYPLKMEIKMEPNDPTDEFYSSHISESETNVCSGSAVESKDSVFEQLFSPDLRKKHKKSKKRQKISANPPDNETTSVSEKFDDVKVEKHSPTSMEHVFDELKRESSVTSTGAMSTPSQSQFSEKKKHKERKDKKRDKSREDYEKLSKEERHRLKKSKKSSKSCDGDRYGQDTNSVGSVKRGGEKMEDIFGPISDDETQLSLTDSIPKDSSTSRLYENISTSHTQQPVVSAALNPYKQEPLTPKSHTVEENEENKQKINSHAERERHRKERREKKRKERERTREQHALAAFQQKHEDENSVDLDEAGRALEAQLMEDSDNKLTEETTPSTATTHKNEMGDVFRFSDGDENSMEVMSHEKKEQSEPHKNKEKKKKKKRSKEERHQKREHHHHSSTHNSSLPQPPQCSSKLSIEITTSTDITDEKQEDLCKPSPSLPCLLDESPPHKNNSSAELNLSISPLVREQPNMISPIPKTPTICSAAKPIECKKKPDKFIPGFDVELDDKISESAVKSISAEFISPIVDPIVDETKVPIEIPPESKSIDKSIEEKSRVVISQEETEDAVAALLGESFGTSTVDYSFTDDPCEIQPEEEELATQVPVEAIIPEEEAEEMRKAVQSLSNEEIDMKPDTPQSEQDLQIDTDTEETEEDPTTSTVATRFDSTSKVEVPQIKSQAEPIVKAPALKPEPVETPKATENEVKPPVILNTASVITKNTNELKPAKEEAAPKTVEVKVESEKPSETEKVESVRPQTIFPTTPQRITQSPVQPPKISVPSNLPASRPQTQFVMQPPTISIPEQTHFVYPPINVMLSPRAGNEHRMSSPRHPQQGSQIGQQSPAQFVNVRVSSPHSPNMHRGPSQPAGLRHPSQLSPVMPQHVVIQQRQLMSPPGSTPPQPQPPSSTNLTLNRIPVQSVLAPISKPIQPTNIILPQPNTAHASIVSRSETTSETKDSSKPVVGQPIAYQSVRVGTPTSGSAGSPVNTPGQSQSATIQVLNQPTIKSVIETHGASQIQQMGPIQVSQAKGPPHQTVVLQQQPPIKQPPLTPQSQSPRPPPPQQLQQMKIAQQQQLLQQHHLMQNRQHRKQLQQQQHKQLLQQQHAQMMQMQKQQQQQQQQKHQQHSQQHQQQHRMMQQQVLQMQPYQQVQPQPLPKDTPHKATVSMPQQITQNIPNKEMQSTVCPPRISQNVVVVRQQSNIVSQSQQLSKPIIVQQQTQQAMPPQLPHTQQQPQPQPQPQPQQPQPVILQQRQPPLPLSQPSAVLVQSKPPQVPLPTSVQNVIHQTPAKVQSPLQPQPQEPTPPSTPLAINVKQQDDQICKVAENSESTVNPIEIKEKQQSVEPLIVEKMLPKDDAASTKELDNVKTTPPPVEVKKEPKIETKTLSPKQDLENVSVIKSQTAATPVQPVQSSLLTEENVSKFSVPVDDQLEQDSKEDSDYWSAKELNIESVIKKVDALCSNDEETEDQLLKKKVETKVDGLKTEPITVLKEIPEKTNAPPVVEQEQKPEPVEIASGVETEKGEDTHDEEEFDEATEPGKVGRGGKRTNRIGRGGKKMSSQPATTTANSPVPVNNAEGVQTRRGKSNQGVRGARKGRGGQSRSPAAPAVSVAPGEKKLTRNQISDQDIYEFHDDSGEESVSSKSSDRPRLILTIKSPGQVASTVVQTKTAPSTPPQQTIPPVASTAPIPPAPVVQSQTPQPTSVSIATTPPQKDQKEKEEFTTPAINTRKSRRLLEKDGGGGNRNTVDDIIEDVVRNSSSPKLTSGGQTPPRRSTRNSAHVGTQRSTPPAGAPVAAVAAATDKVIISLTDVRKSPRANRRSKDRKASETSVDSSDEKVVKPDEKSSPPKVQPVEIETEKVAAKPEEVESTKQPQENPAKVTLPIPVVSNEKPPEKPETRKPLEPAEPLALIDPVTGLLTVVRQSKEGQYVPVPGAPAAPPNAKVVGKHIVQPIVAKPEIKPDEVVKPKTLEPKQEVPSPLVVHKPTNVVVTTSVQPPTKVSSPISVVASSNIVQVPIPTVQVVVQPQPPPPQKVQLQQHVHQPVQPQPHPQPQLHAQPQPQPQLQPQLQPQPQKIIQSHPQPQPQPQPQPIRTHPLKAHVLNSQHNTTLNKPPIVSQSVVKVATGIIGQPTTTVVTNPNVPKTQQNTVVQSNIVTRHIPQSNVPQQPQQAMHPGQMPQQPTQQSLHNLFVNIPPSSSPHTVQMSVAHSPRIQQNVVVKSDQSQPSPQQPLQLLHVVTKPMGGGGQQQIITQQHQPVVIHNNKLQQPQNQYATVVQGGKIIQQAPIQNAVGKHQTIQVAIPHVQQQHQQLQHLQKQSPAVSVVTHQLGKQVPMPNQQQHQPHPNMQSHHLQQQQPQQQPGPHHMSNAIIGKQQSVLPNAIHLASGQQPGIVLGSQHIVTHAHQSMHPHQPTGATLLQAKPAHQQQVPPPTKGVIGLHQAPQIMTGAVASPPLKQSHMASQQPIVTGASSLRASVPPISPQGQSRSHMLQPGHPAPAFEANLHDIGGFGAQRSQSPPPAHQQASPITPGEGTFAGGSIRGMPREHYIMYPPYFRTQQEARIPYIPRSTLVQGSATDQKDLSEVDESMAASPPLELRRPGSGSRTISVPHSLQSPQDRATDSPQVAQVYVHGSRIPHPHFQDVGARYFENVRQVAAEPPPAHRPAHSVVVPSPTNYAPQPSAGPPVTLTHIHPKVIERERERELRERENESRYFVDEKRERERVHHRKRENERSSIPGHTSMPNHDSLVPAMPAPTGRSIQVATPPHASQVPPQGDSLLTLLQRYPVMWQGLLALKTDQAAVQMHFVFGNPLVARGSLPCNSDGSTPPLRIAQRMRLEQTQLEGVAKKMQYENEHCMLLALPCGRNHMDVLQQSRSLQTGFITYLQQKMAAGIVNIPVPGSDQAAYVVHIFPSCDFANENLERAAPDLKHRVAEIAHLLIVIATV